MSNSEIVAKIKEILHSFKPDWQFVGILNEDMRFDQLTMQNHISTSVLELDYSPQRFSQYFRENLKNKIQKRINANTDSNDSIFSVEICPNGGDKQITKIIFISINLGRILAEQG